jgi:hypothetical protein
MKKKLLSITLVVSTMMVNAQSFSAQYPFTSVSSSTAANTGTMDPTPSPTATGVTFGSFTAVGINSVTAASGVFAFSQWDIGATNGNDVTFTGSLNIAKYYDVTITPNAGNSITLDSIKFNMLRSSTGPRNWAWRSGLDAFAANLTASVGTNTNLSVQPGDNFFWSVDTYTTSTQQKGSKVTFGAAFTGLTNPVDFRFYAWNAETTAGTFRIDSVTFYGSVTLATSIASLNFDLNANFNVYPVPNHDGIVYIENKNAQELSSIEVVDVFGNVVLSSKNETASKIKLNLADVSNGNYVVRINTVSGISTKKLVIVK